VIDERFWKGKTVLVTGATGFLGGWTTRRLLELDAEVVAVVRRKRPHSQFFMESFDKRVIVENGSVHDQKFIEHIFNRRSPEIIFHMAALSEIGEVIKNPVYCFQSTIESTWWLLENVRTKNPECITVVSSSDKAYGKIEIPLREDKLLNPTHPYEAAKASQDIIARSYGTIYGLPIGVTRCGNFFGGYDFTFSRIIPSTIRDAFREERPQLRSDGRFTRDFFYIEDAVDVQLYFAEQLAKHNSLQGQAFNFSFGLEIEILDIVKRILEIMKSDLEPEILNQARAETRRMTLDSTKAADILGWKPVIGFDEGLKRTIAWYTEYLAKEGISSSA